MTKRYGVKGSYAAGFHTGVDLAVPGEQHIAIVWAKKRKGRVYHVGKDAAYGNYVIVTDVKSRQYLFAHLSKVSVVAGETIFNGDVIGRTGSTGNATGDHLHLEKSEGIWSYGHVVSPEVYKFYA